MSIFHIVTVIRDVSRSRRMSHVRSDLCLPQKVALRFFLKSYKRKAQIFKERTNLNLLALLIQTLIVSTGTVCVLLRPRLRPNKKIQMRKVEEREPDRQTEVLLKFQENSFCSGNCFGISVDYLNVKCVDFFGVFLMVWYKIFNLNYL